jgi:hypothetical protein
MTARASFSRCLCVGALASLIASGALAQSNQMSLGQRNLACGSPVSLDDGWVTAAPESAGMDGARLCGIAARLQLTGSDVHAVVVARHGKLVFEQYFPRLDQPWGEPEGQHEFSDKARHALGVEKRHLAAGRDCDRSQADRQHR